MHAILMFWKNLWAFKSLSHLLEAFGGMWLLIEIIDFFSSQVAAVIKPHWFLFVVVGIVYAAIRSWPRLRRRYKLTGRDVQIEIVVGDIFAFPGDLVVGSNTTFDTDIQPGLISPHSVQGLFTLKFYPSRENLDRILEQELSEKQFEAVSKKGKKKKYAIGTVCHVPAGGAFAHWVAIADINEYGSAQGSFQSLRDALPELWNHVSKRGTKGRLKIPVLGSGFGRLKESREVIIKEIILSFIAACGESSFCETLMIFIHPDDFSRYEIDLEELDRFLRYQCCYTELVSPYSRGQGIGID